MKHDKMPFYWSVWIGSKLNGWNGSKTRGYIQIRIYHLTNLLGRLSQQGAYEIWSPLQNLSFDQHIGKFVAKGAYEILIPLQNPLVVWACHCQNIAPDYPNPPPIPFWRRYLLCHSLALNEQAIQNAASRLILLSDPYHAVDNLPEQLQFDTLATRWCKSLAR